jgi:hypothetical protein
MLRVVIQEGLRRPRRRAWPEKMLFRLYDDELLEVFLEVIVAGAQWHLVGL